VRLRHIDVPELTGAHEDVFAADAKLYSLVRPYRDVQSCFTQSVFGREIGVLTDERARKLRQQAHSKQIALKKSEASQKNGATTIITVSTICGEG